MVTRYLKTKTVNFFATCISIVGIIAALAASLTASMAFAEVLNEPPHKACFVALSGGPVEDAAPAQIDEAGIKKDVQIIWYPNSSWLGITHAGMIVDGVLWDATVKFKAKGDSAKGERAANIGGKRLFGIPLKCYPLRVSTYH